MTRKEVIVSKAIENRAELVDNIIINHSDCEECTEEYLFLFTDGTTERYVGLRTIIRCLEIAADNGAIPDLPSEWWIKLKNRYAF